MLCSQPSNATEPTTITRRNQERTNAFSARIDAAEQYSPPSPHVIEGGNCFYYRPATDSIHLPTSPSSTPPPTTSHTRPRNHPLTDTLTAQP